MALAFRCNCQRWDKLPLPVSTMGTLSGQGPSQGGPTLCDDHREKGATGAPKVLGLRAKPIILRIRQELSAGAVWSTAFYGLGAMSRPRASDAAEWQKGTVNLPTPDSFAQGKKCTIDGFAETLADMPSFCSRASDSTKTSLFSRALSSPGDPLATRRYARTD